MDIKIFVDDKQYIPVIEAKQIYGCSKEGIHWLIKHGGLTSVMIGIQRFVSLDQLMQLKEINRPLNRGRLKSKKISKKGDQIATTEKTITNSDISIN
jgi:hypothetical protein